MQKRLKVGWLMDFYGPLLTQHRQKLLRLYCDEDMSLAEIAEQEGISRQAVHDALRRGEKQLDEYERVLGLMERYRIMQAEVNTCRKMLESIVPTQGTQENVNCAKHALERIEGIER